MGKLKQLTKSRSIEDTGTANQLVNAGIQVCRLVNKMNLSC